MKLTLASVKRQLAAEDIEMSIKRTGWDDEIRVAFKGAGNEASAYYTNDLEDALDTARAMWAER